MELVSERRLLGLVNIPTTLHIFPGESEGYPLLLEQGDQASLSLRGGDDWPSGGIIFAPSVVYLHHLMGELAIP